MKTTDIAGGIFIAIALIALLLLQAMAADERRRLEAMAERLADTAARRLRLLIRASDLLEAYCPQAPLIDEIDAEIERMGEEHGDDTS